MTALAIALCASILGSKVSKAQERKSIRFALTTAQLTPSVSPYASIPKYMGYWDQEGIKVEVLGVAGSNIAMPMLVSNEADYSLPGTPAYFSALAKGAKLANFYCAYSNNQFRGMTLADSSIRSISDLRGKKIGVPDLASATTTYLSSVLKAEGINPDKDVQVLPFGSSAPLMLRGLETGEVSAVFGFDSHYGQLVSMVGSKMRQLKSPLDDRFGCGASVVTRSSELASNRKVAVGLARGIAKATLFAITNPEAAVRIHWSVYPESKPTGLPEEEALRQAIAQLQARLDTMEADKETGKYGYVSEQRIMAMQQIMFENQQVPKVSSFSEIFNTGLLDEINNWNRDEIIAQAKNAKIR